MFLDAIVQLLSDWGS